jgi:phosphoribosylanthranilate isomerase
MKVKICGMRDKENIKAIAALHPDYLGFIFYEASKRFVGNSLDQELLANLPSNIKKTGVFVNADLDTIRTTINLYGLDAVQLHGDETLEFVKDLYLQNNNPHVIRVNIIKAFAIDNNFDFAETQAYRTFCDYFLFDTKTSGYGGSGQKFDWAVLNQYDQQVPFFLSGGIGPGDIPGIQALKGLNLHAIDLNSCMEIEPGLKDLEKVKAVMSALKK